MYCPNCHHKSFAPRVVTRDNDDRIRITVDLTLDDNLHVYDQLPDQAGYDFMPVFEDDDDLEDYDPMSDQADYNLTPILEKTEPEELLHPDPEQWYESMPPLGNVPPLIFPSSYGLEHFQISHKPEPFLQLSLHS